MNPMDDLAFKHWLQRLVVTSGHKIKESDIFLSIFTTNYERDPVCAFQLGIAIMLDKPVYLLVAKGTVVSENMKRLARGLEFYDPAIDGDIDAASGRLLNGLKNESP